MWHIGYKEAELPVKGRIFTTPFNIQSKMHGKRNVYVSKQMNGKEFVLKMRKGIVDWRSLFIYDKRTRSIRLHSNRELTLSNQDSDNKGEKRLKDGQNVAMRVWKNQMDQITDWSDDKITNKARKCLTMRNYLDKEENLLTWWKCNKNDAQRWRHPFFKNKNGKTSIG